MQPDAEGKYPYSGSLDCVVKTFKSSGPMKFYSGFPVYCVRIAPHVMVHPPSQRLIFHLLILLFIFFSCADDLDLPEPNPENSEIYWSVIRITIIWSE